MKKTTRLKQYIHDPDILIMPGVYDALSAKIAEKCGVLFGEDVVSVIRFSDDIVIVASWPDGVIPVGGKVAICIYNLSNDVFGRKGRNLQGEDTGNCQKQGN